CCDICNMAGDPFMSSARYRLAILFVVATHVHTPSVLGQTTTATLQGVVHDASRGVVSGASVTLRDSNTGSVRTATTDGTGTYVLSYVPAGVYELTIELAGFKTLKRAPLRFEVGQQTTIDASLEVAGVAEPVTVR